jgi:hypothetical protein
MSHPLGGRKLFVAVRLLWRTTAQQGNFQLLRLRKNSLALPCPSRTPSHTPTHAHGLQVTKVEVLGTVDAAVQTAFVTLAAGPFRCGTNTASMGIH